MAVVSVSIDAIVVVSVSSHLGATIFYKQRASAAMADHQPNIMCEVEIQPDIQECVEIESIPVDISDTVETIVECGEPMISMQSLEGRDIILEAQEEIIDDSGDPLNIYDVPVPDAADLYVEAAPGPSKRRRSPAKSRGVLARRDNEMLLGDVHVDAKPRKWEQKQVQIKTMEGEFSVTMWASGASDGKSGGTPIHQTHTQPTPLRHFLPYFVMADRIELWRTTH